MKMAFHYGNLANQTLENMIPLFSTMANGAAMPNHPGFINHLAAAITTAAAAGAGAGAVSATPPTSSSCFTSTTTTAATQRDRTPEPPPAPKFSVASPKMKPNQGTAPMDLENDSEAEMPATTTSDVSADSIATHPAIATKPSTDKMPLNIHDAGLYLNGLMSANSGAATAVGMNAGFMYFPTSSSTGSASASLLDPAAMMAAAMQNYAGYPNTPMTETVTMDNGKMLSAPGSENFTTTPAPIKEVIKTKSCILLPPNPNAPPPTIRERPPGCRTVFVGGLPENISEEIIREIFESCGEISTLRMSKKNFCHIRYRHELSIDRAIYLSGYRVRITNANEPANFGRLHVDYAQARDDQYDYECKQRQLQREQRHRERVSLDRLRSQSPPPMPHYTDHEASVVAENLRNNDTFVKAVQTITVWLERGDCTKRNANVFYSMIQSTHAHVRRLTGDKQQLEEDLRKAREGYRKQMLTMSTQFTQIEKVFSAASHKKVWDHFTKAQRKNIDQWKKLATELRSIQIEDDEMDMSDEDRDCHSSTVKRKRYDSDNLKEENDSLRCQLEAIRNEMSLERTDIKYDSDFREKQIKVLQETIRNMQTQLMQTKMREQKDAKTIEHLERRLKEAAVKQLLLKTKIKETTERLKDRELSSMNSETSEIHLEEAEDDAKPVDKDNSQIIDIDVDKSDDDVKFVEESKCKTDNSPKTVNEELETQKTISETTEESEQKSEEKPQQGNECLEDNIKLETTLPLSLNEAKIIALTTAFLVVQPLGCSTEAICSYLQSTTKDLKTLQPELLNDTLIKYKNLFKRRATGDLLETSGPATNWIFNGFQDTS